MEQQEEKIEVFTCRVQEKYIKRSFFMGGLPDEVDESKKDLESKSNFVVAVVRDLEQQKQYVAFSRCDKADQFDKAKGRAIAIGRAKLLREEDPKIEIRKGLLGKATLFSYPHNGPVLFAHHVTKRDATGREFTYSTEELSVPQWMLTLKEKKEQSIAQEPQVGHGG